MERHLGIHAEDPGRNGSWVAVIEGDVFPLDEQEANARLIAASPELLAAVLKAEEISAICGRGEPMTATESMKLSRDYEMLRHKALTKALGPDWQNARHLAAADDGPNPT